MTGWANVLVDQSLSLVEQCVLYDCKSFTIMCLCVGGNNYDWAEMTEEDC